MFGKNVEQELEQITINPVGNPQWQTVDVGCMAESQPELEQWKARLFREWLHGIMGCILRRS